MFLSFSAVVLQSLLQPLAKHMKDNHASMATLHLEVVVNKVLQTRDGVGGGSADGPGEGDHLCFCATRGHTHKRIGVKWEVEATVNGPKPETQNPTPPNPKP